MGWGGDGEKMGWCLPTDHFAAFCKLMLQLSVICCRGEGGDGVGIVVPTLLNV